MQLPNHHFCAAGAEPREHTLRLALQPGSVALAGAELSPADVDVADIVAAAADSARPLAFVVREVHARLDAALCKASAAGAPAAIQQSMGEHSNRSKSTCCRAMHDQGCTEQEGSIFAKEPTLLAMAASDVPCLVVIHHAQIPIAMWCWCIALQVLRMPRSVVHGCQHTGLQR